MLSEDISGRRQEKEERQIEESRLMMKQEESEAATLSREALERSASDTGREQRRAALHYGRRKQGSKGNVITRSRMIKPG